MRSGKVKLVVVLLIAILAILLVPLVVIVVNRPVVPAIKLPAPNAFDTLSQGGRMVSGVPDDYTETTDVASLRGAVEANAEALRLIMEAKGQKCVVPIDYEQGKVSDLAELVQPIRQAMRVLFVRARLEELTEESAVSAQTYADMFLLGSRIANGGMLVHHLVAVAQERTALDKLGELVEVLDPKTKKKVLETLQSANRQPLNVDQVLEREHVLFKKKHGTISGSWMIWMTSNLSLPAIEQATKADQSVLTRYADVVNQLQAE